jgi:Ser/Thr protein kinase RdoA (MazF antagonist)
MLVSRKPSLSVEEACRIAESKFGVAGCAATELPSERDQNFRLVASDGSAYVLRIAHPDELPEVLDFQNQALTRLGTSRAAEWVPSLRPSLDGSWTVRVESGRGVHQVRLGNYLDGVPLGAAVDVPESLAEQVGEVLGLVDAVFEDFEHPAMDRFLYWDSQHALETIEGNLRFVEDRGKRQLLDHFLIPFRDRFLPSTGELRRSVIHNDANDYNLLVDEAVRPTRLTGLIDFGDMVRTFTACEVANASAYLMMEKDDPGSIAARVVRGYHRRFSLSDSECRWLGYLIAIRLCMSVSNSARQKHQAPDNEYLAISERPAWKLLGALAAFDLDEFGETMKASRERTAGRVTRVADSSRTR